MSNVTAQTMDETNVKELLYRQMKSPVLWTESVIFMKKQGINFAIEAGYGSVISGLVKKIEPGIEIKNFIELIN